MAVMTWPAVMVCVVDRGWSVDKKQLSESSGPITIVVSSYYFKKFSRLAKYISNLLHTTIPLL